MQLEERANFVVQLQGEIKEKEREFQDYCRQVEIDRKLEYLHIMISCNLTFSFRRPQPC